MEANDFLADHVQIGRPVFLKCFLSAFVRRSVSDRGDVVCQRVQPHVDHVLGIVRHRNAPGKRGAADGEITQSGAHERHHLVPPGLGANEIGLLGVQLQQLVLKRRKPEEVILFLHRFGRASALGAGRARSHRIHVEFVEHAILAGIGALVDVPVVTNAPEQFLHAAFCGVPRWCG